MRELATAQAIAANTETDCYRFTAEVVFEVTGNDFRNLFYYKSARESMRIVEKAGGLAVLARGVMGEPCDASDCDDGDPVIVRAGQEMLGVKFQESVVVKTRKFVQPLSLEFAVMGWRL